MKKQLKKVNSFHKAFNIGQAPKAPTLIYENEYKLRYNLASEELNEYLEACKSGDLVEVADALGDQLYILCGTILAHGMQNVITDVFDEIHKSNMSKLDKDGNPIFREDGKVLKSENYFRPELQKFIK